MQRIHADPERKKLFHPGASTGGAFFSIAGDVKEGLVIICEGYGTGATLHELTGHTVVCAMNCHNIIAVAPKIKKLYPQRKILVAADNDRYQENNPGLRDAKAAVEQFKLDGYFYPEFPEGHPGSDWNDFAALVGMAAAEKAIREKVEWECLPEAERKRVQELEQIKALERTLDSSICLPNVEMIAGMFPRGFLSFVIAAPGVGKTWFMQRCISDLSIGGPVFDGFSHSVPMKSLILAGEAGWELLIRRGAETRWPVDTRNVVIISTLEAEGKGFSFDLDTPDGQRRFEAAVDRNRPDIVFVDTLSAVHNSDENKSLEMKPIFLYLMRIARQYDAAIVVDHHTRKRKFAENKFLLTQDEAVGSSILNRFGSVIVGIEPTDTSSGTTGNDQEIDLFESKSDVASSKVNLVRVLKSWFRKPPPFTFKLEENDAGRTIMTIDSNPKIGGGARARVWTYIARAHTPGAWFKSGDIKDAGIGVSKRQIDRCLSDLVQNGKLQHQGEGKISQYSIPMTYLDALNDCNDDE
jgi:hypothetical protein